MKYNINQIKTYLQEFTGCQIQQIATEKSALEKLPLALSSAYVFQDIEFFETLLTLVIPKMPEDCTPLQLSKHQIKMKEVFSHPIAFVLETVESYNITRLTRAGVNFIVPGKIIFLPSMLMVLRNIKNTVKDIPSIMPPVAQLLILYHLQIESINNLDTAKIAERTDLAYPTINVALKWLSNKGFVQLIGKKQKKVQMTWNGKELWENALPVMTTPVERTLYTDANFTERIIAGESALGHYTMLAEPSDLVIAIGKTTTKQYINILNKQYGDVKVEIWKYNPMLLSKTGFVDKLSLFLSLKDSDDERIQMECDTLIEEIQW